MITLDKWTRPTAEVLAAMFTENTGTHFLDSGGYYGRQWQRMQGKTVEDFINAPSVTEMDFKYGCFSINTFQWLLANLTYDPIMQRRFELITMGSEDPHLVDAETFAEKMHDGDKYELRTFNSYNGETLLDSTIQGVLFTRGGDTYVALQIHGGADVRGGYTAPKIFQIDDVDYWGDESIGFWCPDCEHHFELISSGIEWLDADGSFMTDPWEDSEFNREEGQCPKCGKTNMTGHARNEH